MLKFLYGYDVMSSNDEYLHIIDVVVEESLHISAPGTSLVDVLPQRKFSLQAVRSMLTCQILVKYIPEWVPGAYFKRRAAKVKRMVKEAAKKTIELAGSNIVCLG